MAERLLSDLLPTLRNPGSIEDRRREVNDLNELLRYNESAERLAANERYAARPIVSQGRLSLDGGYWDMDRLGELSTAGLGELARRYGKPR